MNWTKKIIFLAALALLGAAVSESALAHGRRIHSSVGFFVGVPFGWPYWHYPPYPSQVVVVPAQPQTYIEQEPAQAAPAQQGYWYYCAGSQAYYPYVKECPGGWQRVAPRPPS